MGCTAPAWFNDRSLVVAMPLRYDVWDMVSCVSLEGTEHDI